MIRPSPGPGAARLRTVFMGTPWFAVPSLAALAESVDVTLVLCNPDRPAGRGRSMASPPVKEEAVRSGIPVFQPEKARHPDAVARIAAEAPDLIVVVAYGHILPKSILVIPRLGCINVHASLLPKYRGAAPINWAVARGETATGITIMRMDEGMDTGPMLYVREMPIGEDDTAETMFSKLSILGAEALGEALRKLREGTLDETPQDAALATHAPMLTKEHGRIDWSRPAVEVRNLVRGMTPWPSAFALHAGKMLKVLSSAVAVESCAGGDSGGIVALGRDGIAVACGEGVLRLQVVQPEGGKAMDAWAYAQGRRMATGERLS
ncbi:MAG: methionyl-tRNA formyltransferase [Candidatus Deferrimicrobium sp.]|nr:methionyl-tRNA formyltransferase [Candidatus Deferrimicrobium sp.]MDO8737743.1 methionyl-tRNA formyltransferase [Candidatus Deferrimicrobium sp.]